MAQLLPVRHGRRCGGDGVRLEPATHVLWAPGLPQLPEIATDRFIEAERLEFQGLGDRGRSRYAAQAQSRDTSIRAGAILRLARYVHRSQGEAEEALRCTVGSPRSAACRWTGPGGLSGTGWCATFWTLRFSLTTFGARAPRCAMRCSTERGCWIGQHGSSPRQIVALECRHSPAG